MYLDGRKTTVQRLRRNKPTRAQFIASHISKGIAFQIRAIRDHLRWSQTDVAGQVGMTQNAISRLESAEYGRPTLTTLKRLASAFDVGLVVRFVPFSEIVDWVSGTPRVIAGISAETLAPASFDEEERNRVFDVSPIEALPRYELTSASGAGQYIPIGDSVTGQVYSAVATGHQFVVRKPIQSASFVSRQLTDATAGVISR